MTTRRRHNDAWECAATDIALTEMGEAHGAEAKDVQGCREYIRASGGLHSALKLWEEDGKGWLSAAHHMRRLQRGRPA